MFCTGELRHGEEYQSFLFISCIPLWDLNLLTITFTLRCFNSKKQQSHSKSYHTSFFNSSYFSIKAINNNVRLFMKKVLRRDEFEIRYDY